MTQRLSFVVPVYRNRESLRITYTKLASVAAQAGPNWTPEYVFVDDGSDDGSLEELLALASEDEQVHVLRFSRNFGQVPALVAGYRHASGDVVVSLSADLQDPPELILQLLQRWREGAQLVIAMRSTRDDGVLASMTSRVFYQLMNWANPRMPTGGFDFVMLDRKVVDAYNRFSEHNRFFQGDLLWLGFSVQFVPYTRLRREHGKSQWTLSKKVKYFIDGLLNTSYLPIRLMSVAGLVTATLGFLYAIVVFFAYLYGKTPFSGYTPLMIVLLILGGTILLSLGVIGEYLWRVFDEVRNRPLYVIERQWAGGQPLPTDERGGRLS